MNGRPDEDYFHAVDGLNDTLYSGAKEVIASFHAYNRQELSGTAHHLDEAIRQLTDARIALQQVVKLSILTGELPSERTFRRLDGTLPF